MDGDPTPALTGRRRTRPTSIGCRKPQQPKPGRAPLILAQAAVQTNQATSVFQCTCGSWVMFDDLGGHWPKHSCFDAQYRELVAKVMPTIRAGADPRSAMFRPFAELKEKLGGRSLAA